MKLSLFDFDGTITNKDSLAEFIQFAVSKAAYWKGLIVLFPTLACYMLKLIPNDLAKEKLISYFFKGWRIDKFQKIATRYSLEQIDQIVRPEAIAKIRWHQQQGHQVVIVTASIENWIKPWCDRYNIELIATRLETEGNRLTGKFYTKNCNSIEKVNRINEVYDLSKYEYIYAYGDTNGDKEMLSVADEQYYKLFN